MCNKVCENFKGPMEMVERDTVIFNVQQTRVVCKLENVCFFDQ
jgi:hypothetical protein